MSITWGEFKRTVDQHLKDTDEIAEIDIAVYSTDFEEGRPEHICVDDRDEGFDIYLGDERPGTWQMPTLNAERE